ncbi:hypothetical protein HQN87_13225 [Paenibacillus tritici]|uniref:Uncharacterized protein n=1 Tax=Paenibacillus tritici TaxID=1873425 RepID=A0ABX2DSB9_9BACL|nr:hypothetical protein [Paenibacillus tritici]NQX46296.1 hypothetical protein [Paenibacillus tritici]QUL52523.1 hypothetical protein KDC22_18935 [Paenibacillus tritici]
MSQNQEFRVYLITKRDILRFIVVEIIIGSMTYKLALNLFHNSILAGAGGWACTEGLKRLVKLTG